MRGSVYQRSSSASWYACADRGSDPVTGKRRKVIKGGFATKREADRWLREAMTAVEEGSFVEPSKLTVGQFVNDHWLPALTMRDLRPTTRASYRMVMERWVVPRIGAATLQTLSAADLNRLYADLRTEGRVDGKGALGPRSVRYAHVLLHRALSDAVKWGLVTRNIADVAEPPAAKAAKASARRARKTWTPEQLDAFLTFAGSHRLGAALVVAGTTGMRRGEVLGVRWSDLTLDGPQPSLNVEQAVTVADRQVQISAPKTAESSRTVPLVPQAVEALRAHRRTQVEERLLFGADYDDHDLVFARVDGRPLHPATFTHTFSDLVAASGLPPIRLHDLRHTFATIGLERGIPAKIVSELLGHTGITITLDIYSHVTPEQHQEAAGLIAKRVFGAPVGPVVNR